MAADKQTPRRRAGRRVVATVLAAVAVFQLLYLVGANGFLRSSWGHQILNRRPEKLTVSWGRAWTWIPGVVHLRDLEIRGRARRAEWSTRVDSGRMVIFLPSLPRRHFRLLGGRAEGVEIRLGVLPPPQTPRPPAGRRAWRVSLEEMTIERLRRFAVNDYELTGAGRATGWARFQVRGPTALELTSMSFAQGVLLAGGQPAADALRFDGRLRVDPFVVGEETARDLLSALSGSVELEAEASSLGFLAAYLEGAPWLRLAGEGHLAASVEVANGWLAPGSQLSLAGPTFETELFGLRAIGEGRLVGLVPEGASHTELTLRLPRFTVSRPTDGALLLAGEDLELVVLNDSNAIDRPAAGITLAVTLPPTRAPDLAAYSAYLPEAAGLTLTGGSAEIEASFDYSAAAGSGDGWLRVRGRQVEAVFGDVDLRADVRLDSRLANARLEQGLFDLAGTTLEIDGVRTRQQGQLRDTGWWGRFRLPSGQLTTSPGDPEGGPARIEAEVAAELRDTGPLVALFGQQLPRLGWMDGLLTVHNVAAASRVTIEGPRISLADLRVTGGRKGRLEILGQLDLSPQSPAGLLFARWGRLSAAVSLAEGERDWKLTRSRRWYEASVRAYRPPRARTARP